MPSCRLLHLPIDAYFQKKAHTRRSSSSLQSNRQCNCIGCYETFRMTSRLFQAYSFANGSLRDAGKSARAKPGDMKSASAPGER